MYLTECGFITGNVCENLCTCGTTDTEAENPRWLEFLGSQANNTDEESTQIEDPNLTALQGVVYFYFFTFSVQCRTRVTEC